MIEIIALFVLCYLNGKIAISKGLPHKIWWLYTILGWIVAEFTGVLIGIAFFGTTNLIAILATGIFVAFGGYLFVRKLLENKPDIIAEDVNRIGVDDLQPPKNP